MAAGREYKLAIEIAGKVNSSLGKSFSGAEKQVKGFGSVVSKVAGVAAAAFSAVKVTQFVGDSVNKAIEFESTMADVVKVVDGLRDENGRLTESYYEMSDSIMNMSKNIPMTTSELGEIMAAAGQAGIASKDLGQFTETAAKMGIAFDTTAEQAGEWMATWRTTFKMSQSEVEVLGDQINYLGNTTSENSLKLSEVITRIGALGDTAGLNAAEIAALAASMTGVSAEVSATGIKNMTLAMTAGAAATSKQQAVLQSLGFSARDMASRMQTDAKGAIIDLLGAIKALPEAEQAATLSQYFGKESVASIAPLLSNLDNLQDQFSKVGDAALYAGSMEAEYAARADTNANKIQLAKNQIAAFQIQIGQYFLPAIGKLAAGVGKVLDVASPLISRYAPYVVGFFKEVTPAAEFFGRTVFGGISKIASAVSPLIGLIGNFFSVMTGTSSLAQLVSANMYMIGGAFDIVSTIATNLIEFITNVFTGSWSAAWQNVVNVFGMIFGGIAEVAKMPVNGVIAMINKAINGINSLKISMPDWVPGVGGKTYGFTLPTIPMLANGGIATQATTAVIGEGREPEAILPLSKLESLLGYRGGSGITYAPQIYIQGNADKKAVEDAILDSYIQFKSFMKRYEKDNRRVSFA